MKIFTKKRGLKEWLEMRNFSKMIHPCFITFFLLKEKELFSFNWEENFFEGSLSDGSFLRFSRGESSSLQVSLTSSKEDVCQGDFTFPYFYESSQQTALKFMSRRFIYQGRQIEIECRYLNRHCKTLITSIFCNGYQISYTLPIAYFSIEKQNETIRYLLAPSTNMFSNETYPHILREIYKISKKELQASLFEFKIWIGRNQHPPLKQLLIKCGKITRFSASRRVSNKEFRTFVLNRNKKEITWHYFKYLVLNKSGVPLQNIPICNGINHTVTEKSSSEADIQKILNELKQLTNEMQSLKLIA